MSTNEPTAAGSRVGRARLAPGQLWQVPTFFVGLAAFLAVAASAPIRHPIVSRQFDSTVAALRQGLQRNQDPAALVALVDTALDEVYNFGDRAAEVRFLAGSVYFRLASISPPETARSYWPRATEHFDMALQLGPDERDLPALEYCLGRALYAQDRDVPRALDLMSRSAERGAEQPLEAYQLLMQANLKLPVPDLAAALAASRKVIELTDDRDAEALANARFAQAELLLRLDRRNEAVKELERIGARAPRPLRAKARLRAVQICEQEGMWSKALATWQDLRADAARVPGGKGRVFYNIGLCCLQLEAPDYVRALTAWQEAVKQGGPEAQAAGLRLGALRLAAPTPDATLALEDWRQALAAVQTPADYRNSYLKVEEVREFFDQALAQFQATQDYERMRSVAELYRKIGPAGYADAKIAQAAEARAKELQANAAAPADEVHHCLFRAAEAWQAAARARPGKEGFDALWHSALCFMQARDADRAGKALVALHQLDRDDVRLAEGWFQLAELHRTLKHRTDAREAYYTCMQYATTPFAARARYQLALEKVENKEWDKAAEILQPNLEVATLDREAHEKSFYEMAWILVQKHDYDRAVVYLDQATTVYKNNPRALMMRSQLAECYRRLADQAYDKEMDEVKAYQGALNEGQKAELENNRRIYQNARKAHLNDAMAAYQRIADELREREKQRPLTPLEGVLGRRAVLGMAECCHDLQEYIDALHLYQGLIERNRGKIESLIACVHIIQIKDLAALKLDREKFTLQTQREVLAVARAALLLAQKDLDAMDKNGPDFHGDKVWTWQQWQQWIATEQQRLSAAPKEPGLQ